MTKEKAGGKIPFSPEGYGIRSEWSPGHVCLTPVQQPCLCPPVSLLLCLHYHTPPTGCSSAPSGVHEQVPLQPGL